MFINAIICVVLICDPHSVTEAVRWMRSLEMSSLSLSKLLCLAVGALWPPNQLLRSAIAGIFHRCVDV